MASAPRRLTLGTKIFLITSLLIALSVGAAVIYTSQRAGAIARQEVTGALESSYALQSAFQQLRNAQLGQVSDLFVSDPYLGAYVAEAMSRGDRASILDLLEERQAGLGFDFAAVLDPSGRVVARTDRPGVAGEDLAERNLVARALEEYEAFGVWREADDLYSAAVVPIDPGGELVGFLLAGFDLTVERIRGTEAGFLVAGPAGAEVVATSLAADREALLGAALRRQPGLVERVLERGEVVGNVELDLGGEPWVALVAPLRDAFGEPVGGTVVLASLDRQLAPFREIQRALVLAGVASVLLAAALSFAFARQVLSPIRRLAAAAAAARGGDYDQAIPSDRGDEVGELARSFDHLLSDLREKRDMEDYVAELSRTLPESEPSAPAIPQQPQLVEATLMSVEFRGRASLGRAGGAAGEAVDALAADLERLGDVAGGRRGRVEAVAGHRALLRFAGEGRCFRALAAGADLLAAARAAGGEPPAVAIADGALAVGAVEWGGVRRAALVGAPVQQLEGLAREVAPGEIGFARAVHRQLAGALERAGFELVERRGVITPQPLYILTGEVAARLTGGFAPEAAVTAAAPARPERQTLSEIRPGSLVGERFEILSVLGVGGMGVVYKARDRELEDLVAVKMLRADRGVQREDIERLKEEIKLARRITHPNVLRTYDLGEVDGIPFISMEYVRGVTLRYLLDRTERLPYSAGLRLARQLCLGLAAAHAVGVIHRDIKPENLILEPTGNAKLMDFGIARPARRMTPGHTEAGMLVGTPQYLAPEQLRGQDATPRSDIYSAGVVLYEIFTGALPVAAGSIAETIAATLEGEPTPPREHWPEIPAELEDILLTCLAKDPAGRFAGATDLLRRLDRLRA